VDISPSPYAPGCVAIGPRARHLLRIGKPALPVSLR